MFVEKDNTNSHILLTGGTGFFGRALLRKWVDAANIGEKSTQVCVLSREPKTFLIKYPEFKSQSWLTFHQGDILNKYSLPKQGKFSHILHAATESTLGPRLSPLNRYMQIIDGTRNMLDYAVNNRIPRFLLTSSGGVYGSQPEGMNEIPENYNGMPDPLYSENAYSVAKRCAEHLCSLYRDSFGLQTVIARCFTFVGKDLPLNAHFAIGNFIRDALYGTEILVNGDGSTVRTYLDQRDLAHWLINILHNGKDGEAYNVGSDYQITIEELAKLVRDSIAPEKKVRITSQLKNIENRKRYVPNICKAREELKLEIKYTLKEAILNSIDKN